MRDAPPPGFRRVTLQGRRYPTPGEAVLRLRQLLERDGITPVDIEPVLVKEGAICPWSAQADIPIVEHTHAWTRRDGGWWCEPGGHGYDGPEPVARATDPETSWDAARSVRNLTATRAAILAVLRSGPGTDEEIWDRLSPGERTTPSGIRTRRAELVDMGVVEDSGKRVKGRAGRAMIVWKATGGEA